MGILVKEIRIAGFRGIEELELTLPRVSIIVGVNNSGKTSVLKAIQLALGDYSRYLSEEDFFLSGDQVTERILVDVKIVSTNADGKFEEIWIEEFGDKIKQTADGRPYVAIRTEVKPDLIKSGYKINRFSLDEWIAEDWKSIAPKNSNKITNRIKSIAFVAIDAQRDIHKELSERHSLVGKVLSSVKYDEDETRTLEGLIKEVNDRAVEQSEPLKGLKRALNQLNSSFENGGETELSPLPKKIRDLSKKFSVHFGTEGDSFSIEYHGMGTRSWASMLTARAFIDWSKESAESEEEPFFPILAAEEPEAHLHPNSQRTLYRQLSSMPGQVLVSTHSPYVVGLADIKEIRVLQNREGKMEVFQLSNNWGSEDLRKLQREVIHSKGELFFSKAIVLSEGETEEQALPVLFQHYFGFEAFTMGVNFVGVGGNGAKYLPYFKFAKDFGIPVFVFSDGEERVVKALKKSYDQVYDDGEFDASSNVIILEDSDFEGYLFENDFEEVIENAIISIEDNQFVDTWIANRQGTKKGQRSIDDSSCETCSQQIKEDVLRDYNVTGGRVEAMKEILDSSKPKYAAAVVEELCNRDKDDLPEKIKELFDNIKNALR